MEDQTESRVEEITRMESEDFQDIRESAEIMVNKEILRDNEKFLAHIKEIDIALNINPHISMETNIHNDVNACRTVEHVETVQEGLKANSGGNTVG